MNPGIKCSQCQGNVSDTVQLLVKKGANLFSLDASKRAPIHYALERNDHCAIKALVEAGLDVNEEIPGCLLSVLDCAILGNTTSVDTISLLLKLGADPTKTDSYGRSCVHLAATQNSLELFALLKSKGADIFLGDRQGSTPIHLAAWHGHESVVNWLLDNGVSPNVRDDNGWTPLHYAAEWDRSEIAKLLLSRLADVNAPDNHAYTPLYWANYCGHSSVSQLLSSWGGVERNFKPSILSDSA